MKLLRTLAVSLTLMILVSCGGWGGYVHKSDRFKYRLAFPIGWEVWDRSDDERDILIANITKNPKAEIQILAIPVAPDLNPHEVYTMFLEGGQDIAVYDQFRVNNQGTIHAKNAEGRSIEVEYIDEGQTFRGFRAKFLGNRFTIEINTFAPADEYILYEPEFKKMINNLAFKH